MANVFDDVPREERKVLVVLDFEGTGLRTFIDRITQVAARAYDFNLFKVTDPAEEESARLPGVEPFVTYVNPMVRISKESIEITGISNDTVKDAPLCKSVLVDFYKWIDELNATQLYLFAYNGLSYDFPLLFAETLRANMNANALFQNNFTGYIDPLKWVNCNKRLNTDGFVLNKSGTKASLRQEDVYKSLFGQKLEGAHDALVDITGLAKVSMHERFRLMWDGKNKSDDWCRTTGAYMMDLRKKQRNHEKRVRKENQDKVKLKNLLGTKRRREEEEKKEGGQSLSDLIADGNNEKPKTKKFKTFKSSSSFFLS